MNAHPANWVAFIKQQYRAALNLEKALPDTSAAIQELLTSIKLPQDKETVRKILQLALQNASDYVKERLEKLPDLDWCASQDTLEFQKRRFKDYYEESRKRILSPEGFTDLIENASNMINYMQSNYAYGGRDAYEALTYAYDILKNLRVI